MKQENIDYFVRIIPFPNYAADGFVVSNGDGTETVFLNANTTYEIQRKAMEHELKHIVNNDLYINKQIKEVESI